MNQGRILGIDNEIDTQQFLVEDLFNCENIGTNHGFTHRSHRSSFFVDDLILSHRCCVVYVEGGRTQLPSIHRELANVVLLLNESNQIYFTMRCVGERVSLLDKHSIFDGVHFVDHAVVVAVSLNYHIDRVGGGDCPFVQEDVDQVRLGISGR